MEENIQEFTITEENREAIGFTDETKELVIPAFFVGDGQNGTRKRQKYRVTKINAETFYACKNLQIVRFPETLEHIFFRAFEKCVSLKNVDTSKAKKLTTISFDAFYGCPKLKTFVIPENLKSFDRPFPPDQLCRIESKSSVYKTFQDGQILIDTKNSSVIWVATEASELVFPQEITKLNIGPLYCYRQKYIFVPKTVNDITINIFSAMPDDSVIIIDKPKDSMPNIILPDGNVHIYWIG